MSEINSNLVAAPTVTPYEALIVDIQAQLAAGASFNNPRLSALADRHFGGSRGGAYYTPKDAYDAMETALNRYLMEWAGKYLQSPFGEALRWLRQLTGQLATQTDRTEEMVELQQFSTPPPFAFLGARLLSAQPGDTVIEPSAGTGNLAVWAWLMGAKVVTNELSDRRRESLRLLGFEPSKFDAEHLDDLLPQDIKAQGVLMNPPFSATAGRTGHDAVYGARHIDSALRRLEVDGRLVAISGASLALSAPKFKDWWYRIARLYNVRANLTISGREFAKFGTTVDTQIIVIDKDGPTPGATWPEQAKNIVWGRVETLEEAWEKLKHLTAREPRAKAEQEENEQPEVFAPYVVRRLHGGQPHPAEIVESASMAAVIPPPASYRPHLPLDVVTKGKLSIVQLENVIYAGQRHEQRLPNGARGGFMVGSGTGVGKGRILAGIIFDNWNQGRRRALWLTVNNDLLPSTARDLKDIGAGFIPLARINDYQADEEITLKEGVVFASFSSLISESQKGAKRLDQIQRWLGPDAVVVVDEASKAKNAIGSGRGSDGTQTGQAVIDLQDAERNPDYRFVYASATGATDVRNMAYMLRFGLWGPGTAFPDGFNQFMNSVDGGGVGAMEMVSRDLKSLGLYLSGSISFGVDPASGKAVEYSERINRLTDDQREMYDCAARAWQHVLKNIDGALEVTGGGKKARSNAMMKFWAEHQRFFNQLITAFNVPACIEEAEKALAADESVVISLVSTGEARTRDQVAKAVASGNSLEDLNFSPAEVIAQMIANGFPTVLYQDVQDPITGKIYQEVVTDEAGNPVQCQEALRMKERLLTGLSTLRLPENPLDQIVNHFGETAVAELTGRTRRLIRDKHTGKVTYKKRAPEGVAMARVNVHEMENFQSGKKRIAIVSGAASMGISLHASNQCENRQRRCHITLQMGWSADVQMQVFGRTHRSDQAFPPRYVLMVIDLGGGKRFCSTIARRLASLGALTKGDRGAADSGDLAKYNFETEEGRAALNYMLHKIVRDAESTVPGLDDARQTLRDMGLLVANADGVEQIRKEDENNIPRFLNRVLALDVARQNALFDHFAGIFDRAVIKAKADGVFDEGVADIKAEAIRLAQPPRVIAIDEVTGAKTTLYTLDIDRKVDTCSFGEAEVERQRAGGEYRVNDKKGYVILCSPSRLRTNIDDGRTFQTFAIWKPEGAKIQYRDEHDLKGKFTVITPERAKLQWETEHEKLPKIKTSRMTIIGGAILPLWGRLRAEQESRLRVVRVATDGGQRIVGAMIASDKVGAVLRAVGVSRNARTPEEVFDAVLGGESVNLISGMKLYRMKVHGDVRIELGGLRYGDHALAESFGLFKELIRYSYYLFVPTDREKGVAALAKLLKQWPVLKTDAEVAEELKQNAEPDTAEGAVLSEVIESVDVVKLIIPVESIEPVIEVIAQPEAGSTEWLAQVCAAVKEVEAETAVAETEKPKRVRKAASTGARPAMEPAPRPEPEPVRVVLYRDNGQGLLF